MVGSSATKPATPSGFSYQDQSGPGLTTTALSIDDRQDGSEKYVTEDQTIKLKLAKNKFITGTWNVRTMYCQGELKELTYELERYKWNVVGLAETRWTGAAEIATEEGHKLWYSGEEKEHMKGVGFLVHKNSVKSVLECTPISSRIISIRLAAKPQNISIIQVYAPTKASDEEILEQFYKESEERIKQIPGKDVLIVQEFANQHKLVVANTLFKHKVTRTTTWHSPGGIRHNQIDFILVSKRYQSGINGAKTRVFPGADIGSDHDFLMMTMKVKLARRTENHVRLCYDINKLNDTTIIEEFRATLGGKFAPILLLDNIQDISTEMEKAINATAMDMLGTYKKEKHPWVTAEVLQACNERRVLKPNRNKNPTNSKEYNDCNRRVRRKIKEAKEMWINEQYKEIEQSIKLNNSKKAFNIVKALTQKWRPKTKVIEDKDGNLLTNIDDILTRWKEYCEELYNHEVQKDPEILTRLTKEVTQHQCVEEPPILKDEIIAAIKILKNSKSPGTDNITA
ncbi:craniofacial development protein 2-like [Penaeus vannamei]|uniref:craniofacial development protein 2-like n=1 Tax=Penaeus vannamei TaxID=6689 RepID=UPI00387FA9B6